MSNASDPLAPAATRNGSRASLPSYETSLDVRRLVRPGQVHSDIYTSQAVFDLEIERIFHASWLYVGHASEIPEKGDFRLRTLGKQPVIMVRGDDGVVRVLMNRCRHRGAIVCEVESGREKFFRCWYHGWTYNNTGKLTSLTDPAGYSKDFSLEEHSLTEAPRVAMYRDFVFASLSPDVASLEQFLGPAAAMIDLLVDVSPTRQIDVRAGVHKTVYNGNWKLVGMDGYHPHYVHASVMSMRERHVAGGIGATHRADPFAPTSKTYARDLGNGHAMLDMRQHRVDNFAGYETFLRNIDGGPAYIDALIARDGEARGKELLANAGDPHLGLFPNMQIINNQIRIIIPQAPNKTEVLLYPVLLRGVSDAINELRLRQHESFYGPSGSGSPDDAEIFERVQKGMGANLEPWIDMSRGLDRETKDVDGSIVGHISDETTQRGQLHRWLELMTRGTT